MRAMDHYHKKTCIRFQEWTGENNYINIFFNPDSGACWSPVGRQGNGEQKVSLGQRCWYFGIVVHELMHAVGFWHEMNRPDRDNWIYIYWNNIIPRFRSAFAKYDSSIVNTLGEQFDYKSIMLYDEYAFSKDNRSPTVRAKNGQIIGPIWRKPGLSASDTRRVHKLYACNGRQPKSGFPLDIKCTFNSDTCGFKNGGSAAWNWRTINSTDGYVYSSFESVGTTRGYFMSINMHPIPEEDSRGPLGCVSFWYLLQGNGGASLKLLHAYLQKVTQIGYDPDSIFTLWSNSSMAGKWYHMQIPFYVTRPFKLIFESEFDSSNTWGTMAMDDIEVSYNPCEEEESTMLSSTASLSLSLDSTNAAEKTETFSETTYSEPLVETSNTISDEETTTTYSYK